MLDIVKRLSEWQRLRFIKKRLLLVRKLVFLRFSYNSEAGASGIHENLDMSKILDIF